MIESSDLLFGQYDIFAITCTSSHLSLLQITNLFWVSEKYPLIMTELVVVHAGLMNLILLNGL